MNQEEQIHDNYDNLPIIVKNFVACWPNPPSKIAKSVGITLRELQGFISRKHTLDRNKRLEIMGLFEIEYDERYGEYRAFGSYVLIAQSPKALKDIYCHLTYGGDAAPYEVVPQQGKADPSWRYWLVKTYDNPMSIIMSTRGDRITECIPDLLLNYEGIQSISSDSYQDIVSTCAKACLSPESNSIEMGELSKRHEMNMVSYVL